jgi:TonB family protein
MQKERIYGFAGACLFCGLLFLFLYFTFIKTQIKTGEEGILVRFGTVDESAGTFEPREEPPQSVPEEPTPTPPVKETVKPQVPKPATRPTTQQQSQAKPAAPTITQNREETAAIAEEKRKLDAINQDVKNALDNASTQKNNQLSTEQIGTNNMQSNQNTSQTTTVSGRNGIEANFSLLGDRNRGLAGGGVLSRPDYLGQEEGKIVIDIRVDPQGKVTPIGIGKGTTINNDSMRKLALEAAKKNRFEKTSRNNDQLGTITYKYTLK